MTTVSDIAEFLTRADNGQRCEDYADTHRRVRTFATRELLEGGHVVDRRGTVDYPTIEVYRAALLDTLANMGLDHVALGVVMDAGADQQFRAKFAPSQIADGVAKPLGGFEDAVRGVGAGENWRLIVAIYPPMAVNIDGFHCGRGMHIRFEWAGDASAIERFDGSKPRALLTIDLAVLWRPLVEILDAA